MNQSKNSMNQQSAAHYNRQQVLKLLRVHQGLSRVQLSDLTQLQNSTMSYIIRDFINRGVVVEGAKLEGGAGYKKQTSLRVNPELGWVIGIVVQNVYAELVKVDYAGEVIDSCNFEVDPDISTLPMYLKNRLENWFKERGCPPGPLKGICLGLPAIVDHNSGMIKSSSFFNIQNYPLAAEMQALFPETEIMIDNDARQASMAELVHKDTISGDFLFYYMNYQKVSKGVKPCSFSSVMFVNGQMINGMNSSAGELSGVLKPHDPPFLSNEDWKNLQDPEGDLSPAMMNLGLWVLPWLEALTCYSDPECVVMGGALNWQNKKLFAMINEYLSNRLSAIGKESVLVRRANSPVQSVAYGAASSLLEHLAQDLIK
ncbi:transcriptional repressor [Lentisphaera araneosa HTCC2155]|uniref:Transcriptional repressor n=1 Tax=Lentisphaera araneosa HTCC2155 TaxID=313628 RepID=A6DKV1_9BACT|nr:ROK family protein [Lentisphaera araneosa]EDM27553.1 transcriptional repressor [Lentisphaera araneosa HTCC2155]